MAYPHSAFGGSRLGSENPKTPHVLYCSNCNGETREHIFFCSKLDKVLYLLDISLMLCIKYFSLEKLPILWGFVTYQWFCNLPIGNSNVSLLVFE